MYSQTAMHQRTQCPPTYSSSVESARDHQTPSSAGLSLPSFFPRGDPGPSFTNSQRSSHAQTQTTSTVLPPVSTLRPSCLRSESNPNKVSSLLPSQVSSASPESPPVPSCVKVEYDSPRELHSHFQYDFSPINF